MVADGVDIKRQILKNTEIVNQKGQSTVEYILMLVIVISLVSVVFKSDFWQSYFGDNGKFDEVFRARIEYSYRHTLEGKDFFAVPNYGNRNHDSYFKSGSTRFFRSKEAYPGN